jgi:heparinase II/III-like protein/alginate lyase
MLIGEELDERRQLIAEAPDLKTLFQALVTRARRVARRGPVPPPAKGQLTADGGTCPDDGTPLLFDPWQPERHTCPKCGRQVSGERHHRRWVWYQHLWLAERLAESATVAALGEGDTADFANATIVRYGEVYPSCPNRDNVLGPSRLFFSTYLESVWLTQFLAGAFLLRESGLLVPEAEQAASLVAEEAANLIGDFDEGLSNRQTWHNAALAAAAVWFEDEDLAGRAIQGGRGLVGHLVDGFLPDGLWYEGENYHLFALRGLLVGGGWARLAGADLFEPEASQDRLAAALLAPARTALPDGTFPARRDARYGVSLAQPMYLELWEAGQADLVRVGRASDAASVSDWLTAMYQLPAPPAQLTDAYLHEAGEPAPVHRGRTSLSSWMLCVMAPELSASGAPWSAGSCLLEDQGLAVLRQGAGYTSLECGPWIGGHGHPDRLHLTWHDGQVHWLPDPGTGSYVERDLFWYRSTLAHNAPMLDGQSQDEVDASCEAFDVRDGAGWAVGRSGGFTRTVVQAGDHLVDQLEFADDHEHTVELPWHFQGDWEVLTPGSWEPAALDHPFIEAVERFVPENDGAITVRARMGDQAITACLAGGEIFRATGPGVPGSGRPQPFLLLRQRGRYLRFHAALLPGDVGVTFTVNAAELTVERPGGATVHRPTTDGWEIATGGRRWQLAGRRQKRLAVDLPSSLAPALTAMLRAEPPRGLAVHVASPPPLDGTVAGFVTAEPIRLDHDDQYRRSEEPYGGPESFSAEAWLNWDSDALYVAVDVRHRDPVFRPADAPPGRLDNEPDDIQSDGLQVYVQLDGSVPPSGFLVVPEAGGRLRVRPVSDLGAAGATLRGSWRPAEDGYTVTIAIEPGRWPPPHDAPEFRFDLAVNLMTPDRERRAGQLAWSGGGGWIYLRGDRQAPGRFGRIRLA